MDRARIALPFMRCVSAVVVVIASVSLVGCAGSRAVFEQPTVSDDALVGLGYFSHIEAGARRDYLHVDDVEVSRRSMVGGLEWWGLVDGDVDDGLENIVSFTVRVYESRADVGPGQLIFEETFPLEATQPVATGRRGSGVGEASSSPEFMHAVAFTEPFALAARRTYYVSVAARLRDPSGVNWQWQDGETTNGVSYSFSFKHARWMRANDTDSALVLVRER